MERIDTFDLFQLGLYIERLIRIPPTDPIAPVFWKDAVPAFVVSQVNLESFLQDNILNLETALDAGHDLLGVLDKCVAASRDPKRKYHDPTPPSLVTELKVAVHSFLANLRKELPRRPTYIVGKRGGFREDALIDNGETLFPPELPKKVPDAVPDIKQATRCIAFDLPTASGYHAHRANEAVLRVYYDIATGNATRPKNRSIGSYIDEMDRMNAGSGDIKATLRDLAKYHRNPLIHPEHSLSDTDEAIALLNNVHTSIVSMLRQIP